MKKGLIGGAIADDEGDGYSDSEDRKLEAGEEDPDALPREQRMQAGADGEGEGANQETPDEQFDLGVEAVTTMAARSLRTAGVRQQIEAIAQAGSSPQAAQDMANLAYDLVVAIDDRTQGSIPMDVLVGGALSVLGMLVELVDAPPPMVAAASQAMIARYAAENGADPGEVQQALGSPDPREVTARVESGMADQQQQPQEA